MSRPIANVLALIITLGVPIILILSNVLLFMNPSWLAYEYSKPNFPKAELFNDKDRLYFGSESIEYVRGNRTLDQFKALGVYQDREIKHMVDVRVLVDQVKIVLPLTIVIAIISLVVLARPSETRALAARSLLNGGILTIVLFIAVGLFAAVGFNTFFTMFHRIFFTGDSWLFLYTDSLIQYYPLPFWFDTSIALVSLTIVEAIIVGAIGWSWAKRVASRQ
ncbi:MAG: TIGR01906 family membrane protein [Chloroflexi bacterium]|nr:TIGR01906 family membrane protein [Chloroflexota bacterium]